MTLINDIRPDAHLNQDPWHELTDWQKNHEFMLGQCSVYWNHPDFEPIYCMDCGQDIFPVSITQGGFPHQVCPEISAHYIGPYPEDWSHV